MSSDAEETMKLSLFGADEHVVSEPFRHRDVRGALDATIYRELADSFPLDQFPSLSGLDHRVLRLDARTLIASPRTAPVWREFMAYLISVDFWLELVNGFGDEIRSKYPHLESQVGRPLKEWKVGCRGDDNVDVVLEALAVINTPVLSSRSTVKGVHIDNAQKLFTGLLYMRSDEDDCEGGNLQFHRSHGSAKFDGHQMPRSRTKVAKTVDYEANRFVGFVNSVDAIHSIEPRRRTRHVRRYVDLVAELPTGKVFEVPRMRVAERMAYRLAGRRERTR